LWWAIKLELMIGYDRPSTAVLITKDTIFQCAQKQSVGSLQQTVSTANPMMAVWEASYLLSCLTLGCGGKEVLNANRKVALHRSLASLWDIGIWSDAFFDSLSQGRCDKEERSDEGKGVHCGYRWRADVLKSMPGIKRCYC
jgi:hypothetical protein